VLAPLPCAHSLTPRNKKNRVSHYRLGPASISNLLKYSVNPLSYQKIKITENDPMNTPIIAALLVVVALSLSACEKSKTDITAAQPHNRAHPSPTRA
jgi:hypothetical protein